MPVEVGMKENLVESDILLRAIIDGSEDAIISKNLDGIITSWNRSAERMFGYTAEEAVGRPVTMLIPQDRQDEETEILNRLKRGERIEHFETIRQRKDGSFLNISLTISPVRSGGRIVGASKIARDITKRKQAEEQLQILTRTLETRVEQRTEALVAYQKQLKLLAIELSKAEERERERLATELHDHLGQLLAVGKMKLDVIRKKIPSTKLNMKDHFDELSKLMDGAIRYTRELMTDLKPPPSLDPEDLTAGIEWIAERMKKHGLNVRIEKNEAPMRMNEDVRASLCQCVRELLFNVLKHSGVNQARILLALRMDQIEITVQDEGEGFDSKEKKPLPTENGGFGLFNIRERMEWLGGHLTIHSVPGEGTAVTLRLPVSKTAGVAVRPLSET